jgi:hypothetical protein
VDGVDARFGVERANVRTEIMRWSSGRTEGKSQPCIDRSPACPPGLSMSIRRTTPHCGVSRSITNSPGELIPSDIACSTLESGNIYPNLGYVLYFLRRLWKCT